MRGALFVLPIVALGSYSTMLMLPVLAAVRAAKIAENSVDYSIQNTARHALFLPTSREAKYNAKQAIDPFFWRGGDLLQAAILFAGVALGLGVQAYAVLNLVLVDCWLLIAFALASAHRNLLTARPKTVAAA